MNEYLSAPVGEDGKTQKAASEELDAQRVRLIDKELKPLIAEYLSGQIPLPGFKSRIDSINKRNEFWGFKGIKGQMFFNMVVNVADDEAECDQELKSAIALPPNEQVASSRIKTFVSYIKRLGEQWVVAGNKKYGAPKFGSIPFFLSYFWQIQDQSVWPVYYTNAVQTMADLNIWQPSDDPAEDYITFKKIHEELVALFTQASKRAFSLYDVEHVFWFKGGNPYALIKAEQEPITAIETKPVAILSQPAAIGHLPESYIPPIVAVLSAMARHDTSLVEAAKKSGISLERAFEKNIDAAFTMLGYETKLLGQGGGRVPDGRALALDDNYAVLWDAKVRNAGYSLGTDDRAIREYIATQSRELSRRYRNIYYLIISSSFTDDFDDSIASIKMETDVSEVVLFEAIVAIMIESSNQYELHDKPSIGGGGHDHATGVHASAKSNAARSHFWPLEVSD